MPDDLEPTAWEVVAVADQTYCARKRPAPIRERFLVKAEAEARKVALQRAGWAAVSVTAVFPGKKQREAHNRARQSASFGDFCADWKMKD